MGSGEEGLSNPTSRLAPDEPFTGIQRVKGGGSLNGRELKGYGEKKLITVQKDV